MRTTGPGFAAVLLSASIIVSACGGTEGEGVASLSGDAAAPAAGRTHSDKPLEDALLDYTRCMRKQGIDMPDPQEGEPGEFVIGGEVSGGDAGGEGGAMVEAAPVGGAPVAGTSMEEFEAADAECVHLLPESAVLSPEEEAELEDKMLRFARCMRDHGVDMPDPQPGGPMAVTLDAVGDPVFEKAQKACGEILPGFGATRVERR